MSNENKKSMSWGWIIFWFIIFWPLGIFFLFRKLTSDKTAILKNSKTVAVISYVLIGFGLLYLLASINGDQSIVILAILFGGGGLWALIISKKMKIKGEKYKKYIAIVVNQSQRSIDHIASAVGVSYETAVKDLQEMIDSDYFTNAYVNEGSRIIVLPETVSQPTVQTATVQTQAKVVTCGSCGANNTIYVGQINECEYCGSPLQ